jgi:hypothetical protein
VAFNSAPRRWLTSYADPNPTPTPHTFTKSKSNTIGFAKSNRITSPTPSPSGFVPPVVISEFRTRGPNGASDEFIEIYNKSDSSEREWLEDPWFSSTGAITRG